MLLCLLHFLKFTDMIRLSFSIVFIIILLVINILAGLLFTCYPLFNMLLNSGVLYVAIAYTYWSNIKSIASTFRTSLAFIIPTITLIELVLGFISPTRVQDNGYIIAIICCIAFEFLLIYTIIRTSRTNK